MTRNEMIERMEKLDKIRFYLAMKDHWDREDFQKDRELYEEYRDLEKKLEA